MYTTAVYTKYAIQILDLNKWISIFLSCLENGNVTDGVEREGWGTILLGIVLRVNSRM
jgi:hypothetical protein